MKLKTFIALIALGLSVLAPVKTLLAAPSAGVAVRVNFADTGVGATNWLPVVTSLSRGVQGISIFNSGNLPMEVGIAYAGSDANAEVRQLIAPKLLSSVGAPGATFYPLQVAYGTRVSIRALSSTGGSLSSGETDMTFFYN